MEDIYHVFFHSKLPRVLLIMKESLQFSPDRKIVDWFLLEEHTIIKVYGFSHEPYILPAFLNPSIFSLELVRQKLIVENEHFIGFRKDLEVNIPWVIGTFIIKSKDALPMIESFLKDMVFQTSIAVNYDSHHIISIRRQVNKNKPFEHQGVKFLAKKANWLDYPSLMKNEEDMQQDPTSQV